MSTRDPGERTSECGAETVSDQCTRIRCRLPAAHPGLHDDGDGARWRSPLPPPPGLTVLT